MTTDRYSANDNLHRVPNHYLANLETFAESQGIHAARLYRHTGVRPKDARNLSGQVTLSAFTSVMERLQALTDNPAFGLMMGAQISPASHGDLGFALLSSNTLEEALDTLMRYFPIRINIVQLTLTKTRHDIKITVLETLNLNTIKRPVIDMALSTMINAFRFLTAQQFRCKRVELSDTPASGTRPYEKYLHSPVVTGSQEDALIFSRQCLELPLILADKAAHQASVKKCESALQTTLARQPLNEKLRARLMESLANRPESFPSLHQLCAELAMSERTLRRHLDNEGTSYQQIADQVRRELAATYLRSTRFPVHKISELLGYSDPSNFGNAFKRWYGMSPRCFRNRY